MGFFGRFFGKNGREAAEQKVPCKRCGAMILPGTAKRTGGLCMPCREGRPSQQRGLAMGEEPPTHLESKDPDLLDSSDFEGFPRWARVAFAARCARRVESVLAAIPRAGLGFEEHAKAAGDAITLAEESSISGRIPDIDLDEVIRRMRRAAVPISSTAHGIGSGSCVACVADAAVSSIRDGSSHLPSIAATVSAFGCRVLGPDGRIPQSVFVEIRRDYEALKTWIESESPTDDIPVPCSIFGPLWPYGLRGD